MKLSNVLVFVCSLAIGNSLPSRVSSNVPPVVLMHGINGTSESLSDVKEWIHEILPGTYVRSMEIGNGIQDSFFMELNKQVELFCENVYADENLANGFNLIGFSQGGLVARGYLQRCNKYPVINFLSWASPQGGVFGGIDGVISDTLAILLGGLPYNQYIQPLFTAFQYWKSPYFKNAYLDGSLYLADINNERETKNETYKENIKSLKSMMLLYSPNDGTVEPPESGWFGFYAPFSGPGKFSRIIPLENTDLYKEDWLGLRTLDEDDRLIFHKSNCSHVEHRSIECKYAFDFFSLPILAEPWDSVHAFWSEKGLYPHLIPSNEQERASN